jgi:hypothetical protein
MATRGYGYRDAVAAGIGLGGVVLDGLDGSDVVRAPDGALLHGPATEPLRPHPAPAGVEPGDSEDR